MNEKPNININILPPFKKFCMTIGELPTSYLESMTYYESLTWLLNYLKNTIIPTINNNSEAVKELQELFTKLRDYVNNYFDNLNVQQEINNKLDEMAENGTLQEIMDSYLKTNVSFMFKNVADMKQSKNLIEGSYAKTLGYYELGDNGASQYYIRNITTNDIVDEAFIIAINENLVAELIIEDKVLIQQLGIQLENNKYINTEIPVQKYLNYANTKKKIKLILTPGHYATTGIEINSWFDIEGYSYFTSNVFLEPQLELQSSIMKITNGITHWNLKGISFRNYNTNISNFALDLDSCSYGKVEDVSFQNLIGSAIKFGRCWEVNFINLIARHVIPIYNGIDSGLFVFNNEMDGSPSTLYFNYIQLENIYGNVFVVEKSNSVFNNHIGTINIEMPNVTTNRNDDLLEGLSLNQFSDDVEFTSFAMFKLLDSSILGGLTIDSIDTNNLASAIFGYEGNNYCFDSLFYKSGEYGTNKNISTIVNAISIIGLKKDLILLNVRDGQANIVNANNNIVFKSICTQYANNFKAICKCVTENKIELPNYETPIIPIYKLSKKDTIDNTNMGLISSDDDSLTDEKLTLYPRTSFAQGGYFEVNAGSPTMKIRIKSSSTAALRILDLNNNVQHDYTLSNPQGQNPSYQIFTIDLTQITGFNVGDRLRIGSTSGYNFHYDIMVFN